MHKIVKVRLDIRMCEHMRLTLSNWMQEEGGRAEDALAIACRVGTVYMIADELALDWPSLDVACEPEQLAKYVDMLEARLNPDSPSPAHA